MADAKSTSSAGPIDNVKAGALKAAFWPQERFTIERSYRRPDGTFGNAKSIRRADAADLEELLRLVRQWFVDHEPEADTAEQE